jgi:hypothetical protein
MSLIKELHELSKDYAILFFRLGKSWSWICSLELHIKKSRKLRSMTNWKEWSSSIEKCLKNTKEMKASDHNAYLGHDKKIN